MSIHNRIIKIFWDDRLSLVFLTLEHVVVINTATLSTLNNATTLDRPCRFHTSVSVVLGWVTLYSEVARVPDGTDLVLYGTDVATLVSRLRVVDPTTCHLRLIYTQRKRTRNRFFLKSFIFDLAQCEHLIVFSMNPSGSDVAFASI